MPPGDLERVREPIQCFAQLFGLGNDFKVRWIYNYDIMRMDFILIKDSKELTVSLESGAPLYSDEDKDEGLTYEEIRKNNMQNFKSNFKD